MEIPEVGDYLKFNEKYYYETKGDDFREQFTLGNLYKIVENDDMNMTILTDFGDKYVLFKGALLLTDASLIKNVHNNTAGIIKETPELESSPNIKKGDRLQFTTKQIKELNMSGKLMPIKAYEIQVVAKGKVYIHDENNKIVVFSIEGLHKNEIRILHTHPPIDMSKSSQIERFVKRIPKKLEKVTEKDIFALIDVALDNKDKRWFNSLVKKLNKIDEVK